MTQKQKLELTWVGKENRPRLEPRVLMEDPEKSYHAAQRVTDNDLFDNRLIYGDNLLALKALEQEFIGKIKCIYIDPPFNTGSAFEYYDDGLEHSTWLGLMRDRLEIIRNFLAQDGSIFIHLDDNEVAYCKVLMDEIFGRVNYVNTIMMTTSAPFGFKSTSGGLYKETNQILLYAKDKTQFKMNEEALFREKGYDPAYNLVFNNMDRDESHWSWQNIGAIVASELGYESAKEARTALTGQVFDAELANYALKNHKRVFRLAAVGGGALAKRKSTIQASKNDPKVIYRYPNDDMNYMFIAGQRVIPYTDRLRSINGQMLPAELITDFWDDISIEGLASEGGVEFPRGKKPEALIARCLSLLTAPGDWVLDSFAGSGTTGAVAHKMGRRWVMVELGEHCHTHIIPRLKRVSDGQDSSGITEAVGWAGGGGFRYYRLAPSLLEKDSWGNWVISKEFNAGMLAEALCKLEGFTYAPSDTVYWQHGRSTERDFIYVTTQNLSRDQLQQLSDEVGRERTLLVLCTAFRGKVDAFPNLTVKKIPKQVLARCEWGHDDYSLKVENLPKAPLRPTQKSLFDLAGGDTIESPR